MQDNNNIQRAKEFKNNLDDKLRGIEADKQIAITAEKSAIEVERSSIKSTIERLKAELTAEEQKLTTLDSKLKDKIKIIEIGIDGKLKELEATLGTATEYAEKELIDIAPLHLEVNTAESMIKHINEFKRMQGMTRDVETMKVSVGEYTRKIELARELPSTILKDVTIPIEGLEVIDGIPLINGLPVSNLSSGELFELCVDIASNETNKLQILLLDGTEKLDDESRIKLYKKCKNYGMQFIATRTTNNRTLQITTL